MNDDLLQTYIAFRQEFLEFARQYPSPSKVKLWIREEVERQNKEQLELVRGYVTAIAKMRTRLITSGVMEKEDLW